MAWFIDLVTNPFFMTPVIAWFVAQVIKTIIHAVANKKIDWSRMVGDGGIPSCHSATVSALAFMCILVYGTHSFQAAISLILAIIVCHDAMGVRREAGKHAKILNKILVNAKKPDGDGGELQEKLKEFVGHTPVEVFAGVAVGIGIAIAMYFVFF